MADSTLSRHEIENLADSVSARILPMLIDNLRFRATVMDAVYDALSKALPEILQAEAISKLIEAQDRNTARASFTAGWKAAVEMAMAQCGGWGEGYIDEGIREHISEDSQALFDGCLETHMQDRLSDPSQTSPGIPSKTKSQNVVTTGDPQDSTQ